MGIAALLDQGGTLRNSEAMLLVDDHQTQTSKGRGLGEQSMSTDDKLNLPGSELL